MKNEVILSQGVDSSFMKSQQIFKKDKADSKKDIYFRIVFLGMGQKGACRQFFREFNLKKNGEIRNGITDEIKTYMCSERSSGKDKVKQYTLKAIKKVQVEVQKS